MASSSDVNVAAALGIRPGGTYRTYWPWGGSTVGFEEIDWGWDMPYKNSHLSPLLSGTCSIPGIVHFKRSSLQQDPLEIEWCPDADSILRSPYIVDAMNKFTWTTEVLWRKRDDLATL